MSLDELMNEVLGTDNGPDLAYLGPASATIADFILDREQVASLMATLYWQSVMNAPAFPSILRDAGASWDAASRGERFLIVHARPDSSRRYDLVLLDPFAPDPNQSEPLVLRTIRIPPEQLELGWQRFAQSNYQRLSQSFGGLFLRVGLDAAIEVARAEACGMLVMPPPVTYPTTTNAYTPAPAWGVSVQKNQPPDCTAGVIARDISGREGVTTAYHAVAQHLQGASTKVYVEGIEGTIDSADVKPVIDSCFITIPGIASPSTYLISLLPPPTVSGPLKGLTPRVNEAMRFQRAVSGTMQTRVIGWSPDIPWVVNPWNQVKVLTDPDTIAGDSGTALIDTTDTVIGFAFYVTLGGPANAGFAAWIWAESVFDAHKLQY